MEEQNKVGAGPSPDKMTLNRERGRKRAQEEPWEQKAK